MPECSKTRQQGWKMVLLEGVEFCDTRGGEIKYSVVRYWYGG
jgi:hypothetical protein